MSENGKLDKRTSGRARVTPRYVSSIHREISLEARARCKLRYACTRRFAAINRGESCLAESRHAGFRLINDPAGDAEVERGWKKGRKREGTET